MQFFTILIINIFVGAVIYLLIRLKLERSVSDFQLRRKRREVDEMIAELNTAAERNVTLLENRIQVMRRLLESSGAIKGLDITIGDEDYKNAEVATPSDVKMTVPANDAPKMTSPIQKSSEPEVNVKQSLYNFATVLAGNLRGKKDKILTSLSSQNTHSANTSQQIYEDMLVHQSSTEAVSITKELDELSFAVEKQFADVTEENEIHVFNDDEIARLFSTSEDKYTLIQDLLSEGYPIETITRFSGMPIGEVKLLFNLRGKEFPK